MSAPGNLNALILGSTASVPVTFDPAAKSSNATLSNGNLTITVTSAQFGQAHATAGGYKSSGKWYTEVTIDTFAASAQLFFGIANSSDAGSYPGNTADSYSYSGTKAGDKLKYHNGNDGIYGAAMATSGVVSILFDADAGTLGFWYDGADQGTAYTGITGSWTVSIGMYSGSPSTSSLTANCGATAFVRSPPAGYSGLVT